jgi:pimeloyl-ACP methyl ester carboxylesterase
MFLQEYGERWLDVDGIRTRYFEAGRGRTIVLVHGGTKGDASGGANAEDFHLNFAELAKKFRVISVDRLGQGYTDNPKRDEDWTMAAAVRHMAGFLRAPGYAPYNLVGHSRGGYVVARVTMDDPRLVESCMMIDSNTASPGPGRNEIVFALNPYKAGTLEASRWTYEKYSCTTQHVTNAWIEMKQKITELPKNKIAISKMKDEGFLHTRFLPELLEDKEEFFERLKTDGLMRPTLLFWGYNDPTAPLHLGMELYDLLATHQPRTSMHIVNQAAATRAAATW